MKKIFISGPMTGILKYNYPAFFKTEEILEKEWRVISPARLAVCIWVNHKLIDSFDSWNDYIEITAPKLTERDYKRTNFAELSCCDAICLLPGWRFSKGAKEELIIANFLNLEVYRLINQKLEKVKQKDMKGVIANI